MFCNLPPNPKFYDLIVLASCYLNRAVVPLIFSVAMVAFIWGVVQYVINTDNETAKTKGKDFMIWGIVGLAVMLSIWGLVQILGNTFGVGIVIPQLK